MAHFADDGFEDTLDVTMSESRARGRTPQSNNQEDIPPLSDGGRSRKIMQKHYQERQQVKERMIKQRTRERKQQQRKKTDQNNRWKKKMGRSPYTINLVAESQRIEEETRYQLREEMRREKLLQKRKEKVKNDIILKALSEESDLLSLRNEKRAIQLEERRLKALLDLEKAKLRRKQDLLAAQRAERKRQQAKVEHRREKFTTEIERREQEELDILREKFGLDQ